MKNLFFFLACLFIFGCKPEQVPTEFEVTVKPQAGKTVEATTEEDKPVLISYEVEDDKATDLSFTLVEQPKYGSLNNCKNLSKTKWECVYSPYKNFNGKDTIAFKNTNGDFVSDDKSVIVINVLPVPDKPVAGGNQKFNVMENSQITFTISPVEDPDTPLNDLVILVKQAPKNGDLLKCFQNGKKAQCTYKPTANYYGEDSFEYYVTDKENKDNGEMSSAKIDFNVMREWVPVNGISSVRVEDKASNALIVFAIDNSNSMDPYIEHMKTSVSNFIDDITSRGFQATIAFITSDQINGETFKKESKTISPHPDFPERADSWLKLNKSVPTDKAVKIYEINAYDVAWNENTKTKITATKNDILDYLTALPQGSDDEKLICSTLRFLNSDHIDGKDFVGVFTLSNEEDDAFGGRNLEQAFKDCHKEDRQERKPIASCQETVECVEGDPECNGTFTYTFDKVIQNPYPAVYSGLCVRQEPKYEEKITYTRTYSLKEKIAEYETVFDPNDVVRSYTRTVTRLAPLIPNRKGKVYLPKNYQREGSYEVQVLPYRSGKKNKETFTARIVSRDLAKTIKRSGQYQKRLFPNSYLRKYRTQYDNRMGSYKMTESPAKYGQKIVPKIDYRKVIYKLPQVDRKSGLKIVNSGGEQREHCHEDWVSLDNIYGCKTVNVIAKEEAGTCPTLPSTSWITCESYKASYKNGEYVKVPEIGYVPKDEVLEAGKCSQASDYANCTDVKVAKIDGNLIKNGDGSVRIFNDGDYALQTINKSNPESGHCAAVGTDIPELISAGWYSCQNLWTVNKDGTLHILETEEEYISRNFDEKGKCADLEKADLQAVIECEEYKTVVKNSKTYKVADLNITNTSHRDILTYTTSTKDQYCEDRSDYPASNIYECVQRFRYKLAGKNKYTTNPSEIIREAFNNQTGSCPELQTALAADSSNENIYDICTDMAVFSDGSTNDDIAANKPKEYTEKGTCSANTEGTCLREFEAVMHSGKIVAVDGASDSELTEAVAVELGLCADDNSIIDCVQIYKAKIDGSLVTVPEGSKPMQSVSLQTGRCENAASDWGVNPQEYEVNCTEKVYVIVEGEKQYITADENPTKTEVVTNQSCNDENNDGLKKWVADSWIECNDYSTFKDSNNKIVEYENNDEPRKRVAIEEGRCEDLAENSFVDCTEASTIIEDGYSEVFKGYVATGVILPPNSEVGRCDDLAEDVKAWLSGECTEETSSRQVLTDETTPVQYVCEREGGTCADHADFVAGSCELKTEAGYNPPTIVPNQVVNTPARMTCVAATGFDTCKSIVFSGTKKVTKTEGCALKTSTVSKHLFTVEGAPKQSLANSLAFELNTKFTKSVYMAIINELDRNTAALNKASSQNLPLPNDACLLYAQRRDMFKDNVDGKTRHLVDGLQFMEVVNRMGEQASAHAICSPDRYPSDKLDYLVADATLNYKVPEYSMYDLLKVSGVKIIYASGETRTLQTNEFVYDKGAVTIVDPTHAKNLVELQMTYDGFEK